MNKMNRNKKASIFKSLSKHINQIKKVQSLSVNLSKYNVFKFFNFFQNFLGEEDIKKLRLLIEEKIREENK